MVRDFRDRVALVTGAGSGIGRATALRLASRGARVIAADIVRQALAETIREIEASGGLGVSFVADVSTPGDIRMLVAKSTEEYGRIDILVNAAGVVQSKDFMEITEEDWDRVIDVNQKGTAFACQIVGKQMVDQVRRVNADLRDISRSNGKIVNFSSIAGRRGRSFQLHYAASKAAIISITQSSALALAPYRINVNCISPSVVQTPMWETSVRQKAATLGVSVEQATKAMLDQIPLHRAGTVDEIAGVVAFLCSDDANFITGQTLNVDGGFEMD